MSKSFKYSSLPKHIQPRWPSLVGHRLGKYSNKTEKLVDEFKLFCQVDLNLMGRTVRDHTWRIKRFLKTIGKHPIAINRNDIRRYLLEFKSKDPSTYAGELKSLKRFFRDFLEMENVVKSFKFPSVPFTIKDIFRKEEVQKFYFTLKTPKARTLFLFYATSGLRKSELLKLTFDELKIESRIIIPKRKQWSTKNVWVTFFNEEAKQILTQKYLPSRKDSNKRVFPFGKSTFANLWIQARRKTGIHITPQTLRDWFCQEMGELGVPDRYIDAFCGRTPKSVLARHYTDYNPKKLKKIYDKANIRVLS